MEFSICLIFYFHGSIITIRVNVMEHVLSICPGSGYNPLITIVTIKKTTVDHNLIPHRTVIDLVSLENECVNNTIGSLINSPSSFYQSGYCTQIW